MGYFVHINSGPLRKVMMKSTKSTFAALALLIVLPMVCAGQSARVAASNAPALGRGERPSRVPLPASSPPGNASVLSVAAARLQLSQALENCYSGKLKLNIFADNMQVDAPRDIAVDTKGLSFTGGTQWHGPTEPITVSVRFKDLDYVAVVEQRWSKPGTFFYVGPQVRSLRSGEDASTGIVSSIYANMAGYPLWIDRAMAQHFVDAVNRLIWAARDKEGELEGFRQRTASWRGLAPKPQLPEPANRERILAENAVSEKDATSAVAHYERGLELYETWPEGWFNLALMYAELHDYSGAVDSMKHYLELAPDAKDAPAVRDQLVIWSDKASRPGPN